MPCNGSQNKVLELLKLLFLFIGFVHKCAKFHTRNIIAASNRSHILICTSLHFCSVQNDHAQLSDPRDVLYNAYVQTLVYTSVENLHFKSFKKT